MKKIGASELIINGDGSVFHLHLRPGEVADNVILVGDPERVPMVARHFDEVETERANREFLSVTGRYRDRRMTVCSTGIGTDNIDIVLTELDALVNVDFAAREVKSGKPKVLTIMRLGTCGALQDDLRIGDLVFSRVSAGLDNLLDFYADSARVRDLDMEREFKESTSLTTRCVGASPELAALFAGVSRQGITVSAPGFYAPQGRCVRLEPLFPEITERLAAFSYDSLRVLNMEMESSAVAGLGAMLGHRCGTLCTVVAQRRAGSAQTDYRPHIEKMIRISLDILAESPPLK